MGILFLNTAVALVANLLITIPLGVFLNHRIQGRWLATVLTALVSTAVVNLFFYLFIHFQVINAHESAYLVLVGPYAVSALLVSLAVAKVTPQS